MGYASMLRDTRFLKWAFEERAQYVVCDAPGAASRDRLNDVLKKAGAKGWVNLDFGVAARVMLRRQDVGFIESNGFTVRMESPDMEP